MVGTQSNEPETAPVTFQPFHAPREHGQSIASPSLEKTAALIAHNRQCARGYPQELLTLREEGRSQLLRDARRYTAAYRGVDQAPPDDRPILMAGHQPILFHPGVWFKNFALHEAAIRNDAVAVNLVVDSDVAGASSIRVPSWRGGPRDALGVSVVPYDLGSGGVPHEQTEIQDRGLFDTFDHRVRSAVAGIVDDPCVTPLWEHAREAIRRCGFAGCALAQARHGLEAEVGLKSLEVPQSVVCRSEAFARFAVAILRRLPEFHRCYNEATGIYRHAHRIRSRSHPVPNLGRHGEWLETPFWVYGNRSPQRRALWVRFVGGGIELTDFGQRHRRLTSIGSPAAADALLGLCSPEFKLRSRALITTMYARLVLSDLFLHGIGGGKYDQLGDLISRQFWQLEPPEMMVLSATVRLPGHESHCLGRIERSRSQLHRDLRDLRFQPERFANNAPLDPSLLAAKRELLSHIPPRGRRADWHAQITAVNREMTLALQPLRERLEQQRLRLFQQEREAAIMNSREHPFCVYPLEALTDAYRRMLSPVAG